MQLPLDGPVSRREFYFEMLAVWMIILLVSTAAIGRDATWRDLLLPLGALGMLALHALALWRGTREDRTTGDGGGGAST